MLKRLWLLTAPALLGVSLALAAPGVVRTKVGAIYEGDVVETKDGVTVTVKGIATNLTTDQIEAIDYGDFDTIWQKRFDALEAGDVAGRIRLAREAFDGKHYRLAARALETAMQSDPNNAEASQLLSAVRSQMRLERESQDRPPAATAPTDRDAKPPTTGSSRSDRDLLTEAQINRVRLYELSSGDQMPVRIPVEVRRRLSTKLQMPLPQFNQLKPVEQAILARDSGDPGMADQVIVTADPIALREYRTRIQPMILQGCATSACHGGAEPRGLVLYTPAADERTAYTNFLILSNYRPKNVPQAATQPTGIFGGVPATGLIDRGRAESSLLLTYGLPKEVSQQPHPPVRGFNGIFKDRNDPRYRMLAEWMDATLLRSMPNYGFTYNAPNSAPSTQPASSNPSTQPGN